MWCFDRRVHEIASGLVRAYGVREPRKGGRILRSALAARQADRLSQRGAEAPLPTTLVARVTNRCNLRCRQCGQWGDNGVWRQSDTPSAADELSTAEWLSLIEAHPRAPGHVYFWGGEPLLRPDLWDLVAAAARRGITTELSTNGTLLLAQHERAATAGLDYLAVSLDGTAEINDRIRTGPGAGYASVSEGIRALVAHKRKAGRVLPLVEVCMTLTPENQGNIVALYQAAKQMGVDVFHVQLGMFTTADTVAASGRRFERVFGSAPRFFAGFLRDVGGMRPSLICEQFAWIEKDVRAGGELLFRQTPARACDPGDYFQRPDRFLHGAWCAVPWKYLQVMPNGDVAFCMDFADYVAGNVRSEAWPAIWNGQRARAFRQELLDGGAFPTCSRCCTFLASSSRLELVLRHALRA